MAKNNSKSSSDEPEVKKDELQILKGRLSVAQAFEKEHRTRFWKRVITALDFRSEVVVTGGTSVRNIKYPLLWSAYDNYISELNASPSQIVVDAAGKEDSVKQAYWKGILDNAKRKLHVEDLREEFVQSFVSVGKAIYKVGRSVKTEKVKNEAVDGKGKKIVGEEHEVVTENKTFVDVVDPRRFWVSPETHYHGPVLDEDCPYCLEEMIKGKEQIEAMYGIKVRKDELELISPDELTADEKKEIKDLDEKTDDLKRVRLYAYYGIWEINGKVDFNAEVLFTKKRIIRARHFPYDHGKKPYVYLLNFKKFFKPLANGCLDAVVDLDQEYNEHMNLIRTILRRMGHPKWAKLKGTQIDEGALLDPDVGVVVEESTPNAFRPLEGPKPEPALLEKASNVEQMFQLLTGIIYGPTALKNIGTATGQNMVENGNDVKVGRMAHLLERADEELNTMILQLEQQYAPSDGVDVKITGSDIVQMIKTKKKLYEVTKQAYEKTHQSGSNGQITSQEGDTPPVDEYKNFQISSDGKKVFTHYSPEEIKGEFELSVVSQSSNRSNRMVKSRQTIDSLKESVGDQFVNRQELWRRKFQLDGWDDPDNLVQSAPAAPTQPVPVAPGTVPTSASPIQAKEAILKQSTQV